MPAPFDWNDIRIFLAVAEHGTTLSAARALRVSQSTVSRRIAAMEAATGLELFDKRRTGYALTGTGSDLVAAARATAAVMQEFQDKAASARRGLTGTVRLATNETFASRLLDRAIAAFRAEFPAIRIDIVAAPRRVDLAKGEADVALRAGPRPEQPDLVGRRVAEDTWSVYCSRDYAAAHGLPSSAAELAGHAFISAPDDGTDSPMLRWVRANVPEESVLLRRDSIEGLYASVSNSTGLSLLSDFVAAAEPNLVRCFSPDFGPVAEIWLLTHERLRTVARVRAVMDFLAAWFAENRHVRNRTAP